MQQNFKNEIKLYNRSKSKKIKIIKKDGYSTFLYWKSNKYNIKEKKNKFYKRRSS